MASLNTDPNTLSSIPSEEPVSPTSPKHASTFPEPNASTTRPIRTRTGSNGSIASTIRSIANNLITSDPPLGFFAATANASSKAPTLADIRRGSFGPEGWTEAGQKEYERQKVERRASQGEVAPMRRRMSRSSSGFSNKSSAPTSPLGMRNRTSSAGLGLDGSTVREEPASEDATGNLKDAGIVSSTEKGTANITEDVKVSGEGSNKSGATAVELANGVSVEPDTNGYLPPPKLPWKVSCAIGLKAFWRWFTTPLGFIITIYGCNVVAWGGMLFLLICNAAPAMCVPSCEDINSGKKIWIEIDSQILNALFCVTGFGLIPWRFRDLWWLMVYRLGLKGRSVEQRQVGIRMLAGIHRNWFRLSGCNEFNQPPMDDAVNPSVPLPVAKKLDQPLTGVRAPPTKVWIMDFVIWCNVWNTFLQACLCGFMWGMNRFNRPGWATGLFIALACVVAGVGGLAMFLEGKKVKKVEGVPPRVAQEMTDIEQGVESHELAKREEKESEEGKGKKAKKWITGKSFG